MMKMLAVSASLIMLCTAAVSAERQCFAPKKSTGHHADLFVDPASNECRAFERELNADCDGDIPNIELKPSIAGSGLVEPAWQEIPLYLANGGENPDGFALLEKVVRARALTGPPGDREGRAAREAERILGMVRSAHANGESPRFGKASMDLEGRGHEEILYRLYTGLAHNSKSINDKGSAFKDEPWIYFDRAVTLVPVAESVKNLMSASGSGTFQVGEVKLVAGRPYLLTWSAAEPMVYAFWLNANRPLIPDEQSEGRTYILPTLRCVFDQRSYH